MPEPILLVVESDPATRAWLGAALGRRFGADYQILTAARSVYEYLSKG